MPHDYRSKSRRSTALVLLGCLALTVYFAHHAMYGRYGIENNRILSARAKALAGRVAALQAEHNALRRDVNLLSDAPHPDMIEEGARRVLGYAYPQTKLIPLKR
ncbi:MAG: FtsB family cell division protein [Hyphomicrobiaceae bacterium]